MQESHKTKLVLFDLDGTLVDTALDFIHSLNNILKANKRDGLDGNVITPSKKGSPIGPARLHLPHQLIVLDTDNSYNNVESCPAARYSHCTGRCTLCRGQVTATTGVTAGGDG